jgi:hypothetical protein
VTRNARSLHTLQTSCIRHTTAILSAACGRVWPWLLRKPWRRAGTTTSIQRQFAPMSRERENRGFINDLAARRVGSPPKFIVSVMLEAGLADRLRPHRPVKRRSKSLPKADDHQPVTYLAACDKRNFY